MHKKLLRTALQCLLDRLGRGDCWLTLQANSCHTEPRARAVLDRFRECCNKLLVSSMSICQLFITLSSVLQNF